MSECGGLGITEISQERFTHLPIQAAGEHRMADILSSSTQWKRQVFEGEATNW